MTDLNRYDVMIIGGSYAGLSAAMALGRSLRKTLIIDSGLPCNRQTPHSHNFITQDGEKPAAIAAKAKAQVLKYDTVQLIVDGAVSARKTGDGFEVLTRNGRTFSATKLIFAKALATRCRPFRVSLNAGEYLSCIVRIAMGMNCAITRPEFWQTEKGHFTWRRW